MNNEQTQYCGGQFILCFNWAAWERNPLIFYSSVYPLQACLRGRLPSLPEHVLNTVQFSTLAYVFAKVVFPFYFSWELRVTSWLFFTTISDYKTSRSPPHSPVLWHGWHFLLNGKPVNHRRSIEGLATYRHPQKIPRLGGSHGLKFLKK